MQHKKTAFSFLFAGMTLVIVVSIFLVTASPASAQCGSQASSCKNCHEVQGQDPVNSDGTGWHQSHSFGDFCYICHAGNQQATDKDAAHQGMEDPLSDITSRLPTMSRYGPGCTRAGVRIRFGRRARFRFCSASFGDV